MTPSASIPTNNKPIAVSPDSRYRRVTTLTPDIMTPAPIAAPSTPEKPNSNAAATPGTTPWASASPAKARPRNTTNVPATAQMADTKMPA
jgi:hypothetical protein